MSSILIHNECPLAKAWWFHSSPLSLDDPLAPLPKAALEEGTWKPFAKRDCDSLENKWTELPERLKHKDQPEEHGVIDELTEKTAVNEEQSEQLEDALGPTDTKVAVGVERLHHVDLLSQKFFPIIDC